MHTTLLTTKLHVPLPCQTLVPRPRLTTILSKALTRRLTLVSAPAGYGKTTLVSNWLHETDVPAAWLSLDEGDNDPARFIEYFITALHSIIPAIAVDLPGRFQGMQPAPFGTLMLLLINEISEQTAPLVLVLDDFHAIHAESILEMLTFFLEHMPPQMHLIKVDPIV